MSLEDIGFYTLCDRRARNTSVTSPLWRCELILTDRCNFACPYCRGLRENMRGDMSFDDAKSIVDCWVDDGLRNVRFSGGEPTLWDGLGELVNLCSNAGVEHMAVSTNGSADIDTYMSLINSGVNDFSVSLDACCAAIGDRMAGGKHGVWAHIVETIKELSRRTYVTVGMVFTDENIDSAMESVLFAASLGVSDIRVIPSAQYNRALGKLAELPDDILERYPILRYRINNVVNGRHVRGLCQDDCGKCKLVLDDMAVAGQYHFPCIIYMREDGDPIGKVGPNMRAERAEWLHKHDSFTDPICKNMCLDVCIDYNNKANSYIQGAAE